MSRWKVKDVEQVALPGNVFAVGLEFEAGKIGDGAVGPMVAGNPLGIVESERARLDGNHQMRVKQFLRRLRGVDGERDGAGRIARRLQA